MPSVRTMRVYRPDITAADSEVCGLLQTLAELELNRLRARTHGQDQSTIETALVDGLARVTAGTIDEEDLPLAVAAIQRGDALTIELITPPSTTTADN